MKLKEVAKVSDNEELLTSVMITKEDKKFIFEHGIVLKKLVKHALNELRKETESGQRKNNN